MAKLVIDSKGKARKKTFSEEMSERAERRARIVKEIREIAAGLRPGKIYV